jgi:hypothetical protein
VAELDVRGGELTREHFGATSILTPRRHAAIVHAIAAGASEKDAARSSRCGPRSLARWLARGRTADAELHSTLERLDPDERARIDALSDERPEPGDDDIIAPLSPRDTALIELIPERERPMWHLWQDAETARGRFTLGGIDALHEVGDGYDAPEVTEKIDPDTGLVYERTIRTKRVRDWRAKAWLLERLQPATFAERTHQVVTGLAGGPLEHDITVRGMTPEEIVATMGSDERDERTAEVVGILEAAGVFGPTAGSGDDDGDAADSSEDESQS